MDAAFWDEIERSRQLTGAQKMSESLRLFDEASRRMLAGSKADDPQVQFETVTGTKKIVVEETESWFEIEFFELSSDPHDLERFARRRRLKVFDRDAWVLTPEDVLVTKLNWIHRTGRKKDIIDVENVISVQGDALDWPYVEQWCDRHGSRPLLEKIRAELGRN